MLKVITVTDNPPAAQQLINSLNKHGWDYVLINSPWRGFGTKLIETYNYLKCHPDVDRFIFCDAHDVVVLGTPDEFESKLLNVGKIIISAEKGCWPIVEWEKYYIDKFEHGFNYLNSGLYYAPRTLFIKLFEIYPPQYYTDDQEWFTNLFLFNVYADFIVLDNDQILFNSHSFIAENEYNYENCRIKICGNQSVFVHSNGKTVDEKLNKMLCQTAKG